MGLSFVAVFLYAGSLSTSEIVAAQASGGTVELLGVTVHCRLVRDPAPPLHHLRRSQRR